LLVCQRRIQWSGAATPSILRVPSSSAPAALGLGSILFRGDDSFIKRVLQRLLPAAHLLVVCGDTGSLCGIRWQVAGIPACGRRCATAVLDGGLGAVAYWCWRLSTAGRLPLEAPRRLAVVTTTSSYKRHRHTSSDSL